jgi:transcriptional regulator with XRE-family HTH domain
MARTFASPQHKTLGALLAEWRRAAGLRQVDLAKRLRRGQDYVSDVETGQKILGVIELMEWADAIGFDARDAIKSLYKTAKK